MNTAMMKMIENHLTNSGIFSPQKEDYLRACSEICPGLGYAGELKADLTNRWDRTSISPEDLKSFRLLERAQWLSRGGSEECERQRAQVAEYADTTVEVLDSGVSEDGTSWHPVVAFRKGFVPSTMRVIRWAHAILVCRRGALAEMDVARKMMIAGTEVLDLRGKDTGPELEECLLQLGKAGIVMEDEITKMLGAGEYTVPGHRVVREFIWSDI